MTEPFGMDIWRDGGVGCPINIDPANASSDPENPTYYWQEIIGLWMYPTFCKDEIFGFVIYNPQTTMDDYFVRIWATNTGNPWGAFKYYANGRYNPGVDYGWWSMGYALDMAVVVDILSDIEEPGNLNPITYSLNQNYPNPFNPVTKIEYSIPKAAKVELTVYDILGREVTKLVNENKKPGKYNVRFDGNQLASGLYLYKLTTADKMLIRKMLLIK